MPDANGLPTPGEAMQQAIVAIERSDDTAARLWLDIAIELRRGSRRRVGPLCDCDYSDGPHEPKLPHERYAGEDAGTMVIPKTFAGIDATQVIEVPECGYCGGGIEWYSPGPDETAAGKAPYWRHVASMDEACPLRIGGGVQTYATPKVDGRG